MKHSYLFLFLAIWIIAGCEISQPDDPAFESPPIEGPTLSDLKDDSSLVSTETLMTFRILTYTLVPDSVDTLQKIFDGLSRKEVRAANEGAFYANGFLIGISSFEGGAKLEQQIVRIGAVRTGLDRMMFPPDRPEAISRTLLRGTEVIRYSKSAKSIAMLTPEQGFLGWAFSAKPDPRFRGMAQIKLFPATWQPGDESIRLLMGKDAIDYQPIRAGQVLARVEEGGVILLGPRRSVPDEMTLDKGLFFVPGRRPKVQFFVIICDSVGT